MKNPKALARKIVGLSVVPAAILVAGALVWQGSAAAFSASTRSAGNSWSTGSVSLTDDDKGAAAFTVESLVPGQTGQKCIVVTSTANVAGTVRSYVQNLSASGQGIENHIQFALEIGTPASGGSFNDCTGFVSAGAVAPQSIKASADVHNSWATGGTEWTTTGAAAESRVYRGTWTFDTTGLTQQQVDALQGSSVTADLVWELQSN